MNVTLVPKKVYETGRETGERQTIATGVRFVRAHWFSMLVGPIQKILTGIASIGCGFLLEKIAQKARTKTFELMV